MLSFGIGAVLVLFGLAVLDRAVAWALPYLAPVLPDDFCGPNGWLLDTQRGTGIFDRSAP